MAEPVISDEIKIYSGIGVVCLQWSLLEMGILSIIAAAEDAPLDKIFMTFGSLDLLPRVNLALNLTRYAKWPQPLIKRIENIRKEIQGPQGRHGLQDERNRLVHGVHKASTKPGHVHLTMVRWSGPKREHDVSVMDVYETGRRLSELAQEAFSIHDAYGTWKFGPSRQQSASQGAAKTESSVWLEIKQNAQNALKRIFGKL